MKKSIFKGIIIGTIIFFITFIALIIFFFNYKLGDRIFYFLNYGITIPDPVSKNEVYYSVGQDHFSFEIWEYNNSQLLKLLKKKYIKKIDSKNIDEIKNLYNETQVRFKNANLDLYFNLEDTIREDNYYAFVVKDKSSRNANFSYTKYLLLFLDTKTSKLYIFSVLY